MQTNSEILERLWNKPSRLATFISQRHAEDAANMVFDPTLSDSFAATLRPRGTPWFRFVPEPNDDATKIEVILSAENAEKLCLLTDDPPETYLAQLVEDHLGPMRKLTCGHCNTEFVTGLKTRRRSDGVYCADRCRVAAHRKRHQADAADMPA